MEKKYNVLLTAEADNTSIKKLENYCNIFYDGWNQKLPVFGEEEVINRLQDKQIFLTSYDKVTKKVFDNCPRLKLIICTRSTPANIDLLAAREHNVVVCNTPGRNSDATAEAAVALLLALTRHICQANRSILDYSVVSDTPVPFDPQKKDIVWPTVKGISPYKQFQGVQIKGKTAGIIGYGSIGKRVATILQGFGAKILIYDPFIKEIDSPQIKTVSFNELLMQSDFISCHTKITDGTRKMFSYDSFCKMKKTAFFVNNSRGAILVEEDLVRALKEGQIAGAALDVFSNEPLYKDHPFLTSNLDNLLLTPHISGASPDAIVNGTTMMVEEVLRFIKGETLQYSLN